MTSTKLLNEFKAPGVAYRGKPFWSWNGELEKDELIRQTHVMKEMGFGGYFMHSRAGLITEYLGDDWFDMINAVAHESEKIGMEAWLYDEDRWPSGSAGGKVTVDPQY
ncbi:MAG: glycoside hydrolase, partial [Clostridia bacterium]|nr:glycoside hydrolase [Clostridia bacterium]